MSIISRKRKSTVRYQHLLFLCFIGVVLADEFRQRQLLRTCYLFPIIRWYYFGYSTEESSDDGDDDDDADADYNYDFDDKLYDDSDGHDLVMTLVIMVVMMMTVTLLEPLGMWKLTGMDSNAELECFVGSTADLERADGLE